jgi:hypothetical protein
MLHILFPRLYTSEAMSSVSVTKKLNVMAAELVFSDEAPFHLSGNVNCHHTSVPKSTPVIHFQRGF